MSTKENEIKNEQTQAETEEENPKNSSEEKKDEYGDVFF